MMTIYVVHAKRFIDFTSVGVMNEQNKEEFLIYSVWYYGYYGIIYISWVSKIKMGIHTRVFNIPVYDEDNR